MKNFGFLALCIAALLLPLSALHAQRLEQFSEKPAEFLTQLGGIMTASKQKNLETTFKDFEAIFQRGTFTEAEQQQIIKTGNGLLHRRMSASPHFRDYLGALVLVKKIPNGERHFKDWNAVLETLLTNAAYKNTACEDFMEFSIPFFEKKAIRSAPTGTSWYALTDNFQIRFEDTRPAVQFDALDLMAGRKEDSIYIRKTSGIYLPIEQRWKGNKGTVSWSERFGPETGAFAELDEYEFELKKSLYELPKVRFYYPLYFGNNAITGSFSDKLVTASSEESASFPRFESDNKVLKINNLGEGLKYEGGFRLHGRTLYGYGSKDAKAKLEISNLQKERVFYGEALLFTIRREERISSNKVDGALYFGKDSIYHPSIDLRYDIKSRQLQLTRGQSATDRNPFFDSYHKVNIDSENIVAYMDSDSIVIGKRTISISNKGDVVFESMEFFKRSEYHRIQNLADNNPIAIMKVTAEREGSNFIDANLLATRINPKFTVENIQSLLYDLVSKGFVNYDSDKQLVEVKEKVFHYANADQNKVDYDVLAVKSLTDNTNAVLNTRNGYMMVDGVENIELSSKQRVALKPLGKQVVMRKNRNIDMDGRVFAGFSMLEGRDIHFEYDKFQLRSDSIRYFDLYVPTGQLDSKQQPIAHSIASRIEHLKGVLLIDAPSNKSSREDIEMFPSLQSKDLSYVYYDYDSTQNRAYKRDSFYFALDPFSFNHIDKYTAADVKFNGNLVSANIFPKFKETIVLREDQSLGFVTKTPVKGHPAYTGKGSYIGEIDLSNKGLLGKGDIKYLGASINSEDIVFKPKQALASAEKFNLEENRNKAEEVPQVRGIDVRIDWRPYQDSMYVRSKEAPFALYKSNDHTLKGTLILTPGGLKGNGLFEWSKAEMNSKLMAFGAFSAKADTTSISIKSVDPKKMALQTQNVNGYVDFDEKIGEFEANGDYVLTTLPYNQYETSFHDFTWDMKTEEIKFQEDTTQLATFLSIHPGQDSLKFEGGSARYDLKNSLLQISHVPHIVAADAFIYPDSNYVEIGPEGVMKKFEDAKIVADTLNKQHVINKAKVEILGRKLYKASGYYEYNIAGRDQEILFQEIIGQRIGKGQMDEKRVETRASGTVEVKDSFYIDHKTTFQGKISLNAQSKNLTFDGFAHLEAEKLPLKPWFTVSSEGDKTDLHIAFNSPKSIEGEPLFTGLFLSKETARIYPRAMMPLSFRKDRPILPVKGVFKYDEKLDHFIFGDSSKIVRNELKGNVFTFKNKDGKVEAEGRFNIGSGLKYIKVDAAGFAQTAFPEPAPEPEPGAEDQIMSAEPEQTMSAEPDSVAMPKPKAPAIEIPMTAELMSGVKMIVPEKLMSIMINDFKSAGFDARIITYLTDINFYKKAANELFPQDKEAQDAINGISSGYLDIPKKYNDYTFLFSRLKMRWDGDLQSFVTTDNNLGLVSMNGESFNKVVTGYVEFKMPTADDDDRVYVHLKSPSQLFYFFGYKQGILSVTSNNPAFMEALQAMKAKDLVMKMPDGETYEIQAVDLTTANQFVRRVEAAGK
ncbi:MAG: hypothetical protein ACKV1O_25905 [Saprospiraceae bacterium]